MCYDQIGLCTYNTLVILGSIANTIEEGLYDYLKRKTILIWASYDILRLHSISQTWNNNLCFFELLTKWNNSWLDPSVKSVCRVGNAHNKTTHPYNCLAGSLWGSLFVTREFFLFWKTYLTNGEKQDHALQRTLKVSDKFILNRDLQWNLKYTCMSKSEMNISKRKKALVTFTSKVSKMFILIPSKKTRFIGQKH